MAKNTHQAPSGTRDVYPLDAARRRFMTESWRRASILHGFEEVDGPTFEHLDLYTVKSGEGIISELFSFTRTGGEKTYALRPEFTPTLARLFAAKAGSLPKPTKWFTLGAFFRAERPQRGRLREFLQWNVDMLGDDSPAADAEVIATCVSLLASLGLTPKDIRVKVNHRYALQQWLVQRGLEIDRHADLFKLLDQRGKLPDAEFTKGLAAFGFNAEQAEIFSKGVVRLTVDDPAHRGPGPSPEVIDLTFFAQAVTPLAQQFTQMGIVDWIDFDMSVVRGLAYYTGMVFEVHEASGAERAIAGGGRYDNLVELFGGPKTPAVGFGMGDVVLALVLQDRGLMPTDAALMEQAGFAPDIFVISNGQPESDELVRPLCAALRRAGLHARHTYKATKNVGKLLKDANDSGAKFVAIVENAQLATLKDLHSGQQDQAPTPISLVPEMVRQRLGRVGG